MSRTNRGSKPQGHDMWGARPCAGQSNSSKKTCRRVERQQGKRVVCDEIEEAIAVTAMVHIPCVFEEEEESNLIAEWEDWDER